MCLLFDLLGTSVNTSTEQKGRCLASTPIPLARGALADMANAQV